MAEPNWQNQTMWTGDCLNIMRGMNSESVDLIYLDPPFNSNANYAAPIGSKAAGAAFTDTWGLDDINLAWHGEIKADYPGLYALLTATREIHGDSMMSYLIYMAIRIMEMGRLLKPTGSIYLHCDPTASHYLKMLMDAVFKPGNFRSEITWKRTSAHNDAKGLGQVYDVVLYYAKTQKKKTWNLVTVPHDPGYVARNFRHNDARGQYRLHEIIRTASMGERPNLAYEYKGYTPRWGWRMVKEKLAALDADGRLVWSKTGRPYRKTYLGRGQSLTNLWIDIPTALGNERQGYPTQKPLALLRRIIQSSSNSGDMILDPFCGCATACVAAQSLNRQWVGIDMSPKAADLVQSRMREELGLFFSGTHRDKPPIRTDLGKIIRYNDMRNKKYLYGEQGGYCNGCETHFEMRHLQVDHIIAKSLGGTDHISNLQLLCGSCNTIKGTKSQEELIVALTDKGYIKRKMAA